LTYYVIGGQSAFTRLFQDTESFSIGTIIEGDSEISKNKCHVDIEIFREISGVFFLFFAIVANVLLAISLLVFNFIGISLNNP